MPLAAPSLECTHQIHSFIAVGASTQLGNDTKCLKVSLWLATLDDMQGFMHAWQDNLQRCEAENCKSCYLQDCRKQEVTTLISQYTGPITLVMGYMRLVSPSDSDSSCIL